MIIENLKINKEKRLLLKSNISYEVYNFFESNFQLNMYKNKFLLKFYVDYKNLLVNEEFLSIKIDFSKRTKEEIENLLYRFKLMINIDRLLSIDLNFSENKIENLDILTNVLSRFTKLISFKIDLGFNKIENNGARQIASLIKGLHKLSTISLNLINNNIKIEVFYELYSTIFNLKYLLSLKIDLGLNKF